MRQGGAVAAMKRPEKITFGEMRAGRKRIRRMEQCFYESVA
jgi:hypothetical protein